MGLIKGFYVEQHGKLGLPVIFIHPPYMGHAVFHYQKMLAGVCRVILYDQRGHGRTSCSADNMSIEQMAEDLFEIVEGLNLEEVVLCGYSSGGYIAQEFALKYPERTKGVILCGGFSEVRTFWLQQEFRIGIGILKTGYRRSLAGILANGHAVHRGDFGLLYHYALKSKKEAAIKLYEEGLRYSCTDRLTELRMPFYLLYGEKDEYLHYYLGIYRGRLTESHPYLIADRFHQLPTKGYPALNHCLRTIVHELSQ
ncbi:alpha/beta hydrolase [Bacillus tianshenii]|nr:alpha/beta hydrolase [Bacillus tianshenii]